MSNENLIFSRGELYFDRFLPGTFVGEGEMYLGNTPGFSLSRNIEEVQRYTSYGGRKIKRDNLVVSETHEGEITTDNISVENLALWFGGEVDSAGQDAINVITETITVKRGRWFQLGTSIQPFGVRHVEPDITFSNGTTSVTVAGNLTLDRPEGRFFVRPDALDIDDGDTLTAEFQWRSSSRSFVVTEATEIVGALRFIATSPHGPRIHQYFPYVALKPSQEIDLKATDWQEISFDVEVRRKSPALSPIYAIKVADAKYTDDESAIINLGPMSLDDFPFYENILDASQNTGWPVALNYTP